jgi:hypothetical protein
MLYAVRILTGLVTSLRMLVSTGSTRCRLVQFVRSQLKQRQPVQQVRQWFLGVQRAVAVVNMKQGNVFWFRLESACYVLHYFNEAVALKLWLKIMTACPSLFKIASGCFEKPSAAS